MGRITHLLLIVLVICILLPPTLGALPSNVYSNGAIGNGDLLAACSTIAALLFVWRDSVKRDRQHLEHIRMLVNASRREGIQEGIVAAANNIYSWRKDKVEHGAQIFLSDNLGNVDYECIVKWDLLYRSSTIKRNSYEFRVRFTLFPKGAVSRQVEIGNPSEGGIFNLPHDFFESDMYTHYEVRINRFDGEYGTFGERGIETAERMPADIYNIICNALASIQALGKNELNVACKDFSN